MRISFLLGVLVLTSFLLHGQVKQGDLLMTSATNNSAMLSSSPLAVSSNGGSISRTTDEEGLIFAFLPTVGYALTDNLVAGIGVNLVLGRDTESESADGVSPYVRYYFVNQELWHLYAGGRVTFVLSDSDVRRVGRTLVSPTVGVGVALGEGLFLSPELSYVVNRDDSPVLLELKFDVLLPTRNRLRYANPYRYERGTWMLGTRMGRLAVSTPDNGRNLLKLSPEVHFFAANQLGLGLEFGTEISWAENLPTNSSVHGGISLRYVPVHDRTIDLFGQAGVHVESGGGTMSERLDLDGGALFHFNVGIGAMLFPRDYFALEAGLGGAHYPVSGFTEMALSGGVRIFPGR